MRGMRFVARGMASAGALRAALLLLLLSPARTATAGCPCLDTLDLSMLDSLSRLEIKCDHLGLLLLSGCSRSVVTLPSTSKII